MNATQMKMQFRGLSRLAGVGIALTLTACGPVMKQWAPEDDKARVFSVATQQLPPEPTYNRLRWTYLPEPLPSSDLPESQAKLIYPVFHLQLQKIKLEDAARILAGAVQYTSYCASTVAEKKITIDSLGTIDELAHQLAVKSDTRIVVDKENREIRVLAGDLDQAVDTAPKFVSED